MKPAAPRPPAPGERPRSGGEGSGPIGDGCPAAGIVRIDPAHVRLGCMSVTMLIAHAYRVEPYRITGPDWMDGRGAPKFEVDATLPAGASERQIPEMLQTLLAARFGLRVHPGSVNQEILALVVAKGGAKLPKASSGPGHQVPGAQALDPAKDAVWSNGFVSRALQARQPDGSTILQSDTLGTVRWSNKPPQVNVWEAPNMTLDGLAEMLSGLGPIGDVVNQTGISGRYDLSMEFSLAEAFHPDAAPASAPRDGAAIESAERDMREGIIQALDVPLARFGLTLQRRKGTARTLVVDHVERKPTGN